MKILFQGDSVTDPWNHSDNYLEWRDDVYAKIAAELIKEKYPDVDFEFVNRAIGGDKTENLLNRLQADFIDVAPDIVSILIGINDTWHYVDKEERLSDDVFESNYREVLSAIKTKTKARIIMLEPFLLDVPDKRNFHPDLDNKIQIVRRLSREFADVYVPLDGLFAAASVIYPPTHWADDGVHPNINGAELIAKYYLNAISSLID